jgi:hypothetical protein
MFALTTLAYPVVLALLCVGAGLLSERASGVRLPAVLLPAIGAACLIVVSQLSTYLAALAPATPYLMLAAALAGAALGRRRLAEGVRAWRSHAGDGLVFVLAYALALAPVLAAGRPTFSAYMTLADSAFHMMGADFLIHHGQDYSHVDLANSYGGFIGAYYRTGYPSGADTLFGGSASLVGLPLIWAFQPFNAFMLATAVGPALLLARRVGLQGTWAALTALTMTLPALVYAYELIGSVKEIVALPLILCAGALAVAERRWLAAGPRGAIPLAVVFAAGIGALGVAFGAWALTAALVAAVLLAARIARGGSDARASAVLIGVGALVLAIGALPTWSHLGASLHVAKAIASTANPGNLHTPLRASQLFGVWFGPTYTESPAGAALALNNVSVALALIVAAVGAVGLVRSRRFSPAGWLALAVALWLVLDAFVSTWANAKTLMLTSSVVVLAVWAGIAAIRRSPARALAPALATLFVAGVLVSDAIQYHSTNLAPTARYDELAQVGERFAGHGPAVVTDFDEYALYQLRDLDIGGPDFAYPPPALASAAGGYGKPVRLSRLAPAALRSYPLIVTRRDPSLPSPPAPYRLAWQGVYYQVWRRAPATAGRAFPTAVKRRSRPVRVALTRALRPRGWALVHRRIVMGGPGTLTASFDIPRAGVWEVWLEGDLMRALTVSVDSRTLGTLAGQLDGNTLVVNALTPLRVRLSAGRHTLTLTRPGASIAPGDGGQATLVSAFLVPA